MKTIALILSVALCVVSSVQAQDSKAVCDEIDALMEQIKLADAKSKVDDALTKFPNDFEVKWRASRVYVAFGDTQPKSEQEKIYVKAKELADEAIKLNPQASVGYVRRAAANGKVALFRGVLSVKDLVKQTKADAEKAIQLNSSGEQVLATAYYILGRTHLKLSETPEVMRMPIGLAWGNLDDALKHLAKAAELRGDFIMFRLDYARALEKDDKFAEARAQLEKIPSLKAQEYGDNDRKKEAAELLEKLKGK
ncbi:MAG: hypothetical protein HY22_01120 [[Candidatus Thermochlorobacteriaceae] bacterium GBChlB]|nr:MAG: hypothetical protein HY22_01120 [[Candidatus Thermochlorobacteriaceae] bacterium GBChlB]